MESIMAAYLSESGGNLGFIVVLLGFICLIVGVLAFLTNGKPD